MPTDRPELYLHAGLEVTRTPGAFCTLSLTPNIYMQEILLLRDAEGNLGWRAKGRDVMNRQQAARGEMKDARVLLPVVDPCCHGDGGADTKWMSSSSRGF